ncbi:hypothetical protein PMIN01_04760 [Paraphaeosphaeria minitans]|uniref:Uncharacterized protein n=1 Tax=Paraphaeosphaeria minitans TaxID=565426 RepID=A0A9P6GKP9_9PLEO|nr:hypothetical protein PMIN01_04760 [Paraphaeosphaeria minitans]
MRLDRVSCCFLRYPTWKFQSSFRLKNHARYRIGYLPHLPRNTGSPQLKSQLPPAFRSLAILSRFCSSQYSTNAWFSAFLAWSTDAVRRICDVSDRFDAGVATPAPAQLAPLTNAGYPNIGQTHLGSDEHRCPLTH